MTRSKERTPQPSDQTYGQIYDYPMEPPLPNKQPLNGLTRSHKHDPKKHSLYIRMVLSLTRCEGHLVGCVASRRVAI